MGLLEHHPLLFDKAEAIEIRTGAENFTWIGEGYPLSRIRENAEAIFEKRVTALCKLIEVSRQRDLFTSALDEMDIAGTSCGLLCGK